jgi:hypothetical protein
MRFMDHGAFNTVASSAGDGTYVATLPFVMPGEWEMLITFGTAGDRLVVDLDDYE